MGTMKEDRLSSRTKWGKRREYAPYIVDRVPRGTFCETLINDL